MGDPEDKRTAVEFSVTLSGQLIGAALAMLAVEGGYVAYVMSSRTPENVFPWISAAAGSAFIFSVLLAGKAITNTRNAGFDGKWSLEAGKSQYNLQALLCALGLMTFGSSFFFSGPSAGDKIEAAIVQLRATDDNLRERVTVLSVSNMVAFEQMRDAVAELEQIRAEVVRLTALADKIQESNTRYADLVAQMSVAASNQTMAILSSVDRVVLSIANQKKIPAPVKP